MNQQLVNDTSHWVDEAGQIMAPEQAQRALKASFEKSQETVGAIKEAIEDATREYGRSLDTVENHSSSLGEKLFQNYTLNTKAAGQFVADLASAKSLPEAAQIQMDFWKTQSQVWQRQMFEVSTMWGRLAFYPSLTATHTVAKSVREAVSPK